MISLVTQFKRLSVVAMSEKSFISEALSNVRENITKAHQQYQELVGCSTKEPCLVAVSKTKPNELIEEAYKCGQRHFGENYVQELVQKAKYFQEAGYKDIKWHFIGHLQRNKVNNLLGAPNLHMVETVDSIKLADAINKSWEKKESGNKLSVFAQVNSSGEENKSGCAPSDCGELVNHILANCSQLKLAGIMTIGSYDHDYSAGPNPDFQCLVKCREEICGRLHLNSNDIDLSMGMSADYQHAILAGSTNIRVGSTIFGART